MMERYPILRAGRTEGSIRTFPDFIEVTREGTEHYYLWSVGRGVRLLPQYTNVVRNWYEPGLGVIGYTAYDIEAYVETLLRELRDHLKGKRVLVDFSGGKDSVATLALLQMLSESLDFKVYAGYVHMPFLEPPENLDFAEYAAERLGAEFVMVEAERKIMRFYLESTGLPKRGRRWCTYLKIRGLRRIKKIVRPHYEAKGDRLLEAGKRLRRLYHYLRSRKFLDGTKLNVVYPLTILDVVNLVRRVGLTHPQYLAGIPRVSCKYCPYKSLYELEASEGFEVEDEGYVEYVARREYQRIYSLTLEWDEFWSQHLWRFSPTPSSMLASLRAQHPPSDTMDLEEARSLFSSLWTEPLPDAEKLSLEGMMEVALLSLEGDRASSV